MYTRTSVKDLARGRDVVQHVDERHMPIGLRSEGSI